MAIKPTDKLKTFQPHQLRVIAERDTNTKNLAKLEEFILGDVFPSLPEKERILLERQKGIMHDFVAVLNARISLF